MILTPEIFAERKSPDEAEIHLFRHQSNSQRVEA